MDKCTVLNIFSYQKWMKGMRIGKSGYVGTFDFGVWLTHHLMDSTALFWFRRAIFGAIYTLIVSQLQKPQLHLALGSISVIGEDTELKGSGISYYSLWIGRGFLWERHKVHSGNFFLFSKSVFLYFSSNARLWTCVETVMLQGFLQASQSKLPTSSYSCSLCYSIFFSLSFVIN